MQYDDIINVKRHVSKIRKPMAIENRAMQFAPFAALTGYEDEVRETARLTENKIEIDDDLKEILNGKIQLVQEQIRCKKISDEIIITYFISDEKKQGGRYVEVTGRVKKIDEYKKLIYLENGKQINIENIIDIINLK